MARLLIGVASCAMWGKRLNHHELGPYDSAFGAIVPKVSGARKFEPGIDQKTVASSRNVLLALGIFTPGHIESTIRFAGGRGLGKFPAAIELGDQAWGANPDPQAIRDLAPLARQLYSTFQGKERRKRHTIPPKPARISEDQWLITCAVRDENRRRTERRQAFADAHTAWTQALPDSMFGGPEARRMLWSGFLPDIALDPVTADDFRVMGPDVDAEGNIKHGGRATRYAQLVIARTHDELQPATWPAKDCSWNPNWPSETMHQVRAAILHPRSHDLPDFAKLVHGRPAMSPQVAEDLALPPQDEPLYPESVLQEWLAETEPQPSTQPEPATDPAAPASQLFSYPEATSVPAKAATAAMAKKSARRPQTPRPPAGGEDVVEYTRAHPEHRQLLADCFAAFVAGKEQSGITLTQKDYPKARRTLNAVVTRLRRAQPLENTPELLVEASTRFAASTFDTRAPSEAELSIELAKMRRASGLTPMEQALREGARGGAATTEAQTETVAARDARLLEQARAMGLKIDLPAAVMPSNDHQPPGTVSGESEGDGVFEFLDGVTPAPFLPAPLGQRSERRFA